MTCNGEAPVGWIPYTALYGDYEGNGCLCSPACMTVKVAPDFEATALEGICKPLPCYKANACSPPCYSQMYLFQGCCGIPPGGLPCCCCPVPMSPNISPCGKKDTYCIDGGRGGCYRFADKDKAYSQCTLCCGCIQLCDMPCGYVRSTKVSPHTGAPAVDEMAH